MTNLNLGTLELVDLRELWQHEERNFTPWLAENLNRLGAVLGMNLVATGVEDIKPGAGRADILARETNSGVNVVIENQLEWSDGDHLVRLLGYAATRDAQAVVWVSGGFWQWHLDILDWLSKEGVDIYGVKVSAWRINDSVAPYFELVAGSGGRREQAETGPATGHVAYGGFFRPLTAQLRDEGFQPIGGRQGGWTGRNRSFRTGYEAQWIYYTLQIGGENGKSWAQLYLGSANHQSILEALSEFRAEIEGELEGLTLEWETSEEGGCSWLAASIDGSLDEPEERLEAIRAWMRDSLVKLRGTVQPWLDMVMDR